MSNKNIFIGAAVIGAILAFFIVFGAPRLGAAQEQFTVPKSALSHADIAEALKSQGFVRNALAFRAMFFILYGHANIASGGYYISKSDNAWTIARTLSGAADMKWVTIPEGLRKEEIADILKTNLNWSSSTEAEFLADTNANANYIEGVYFPDTYLIPTTDAPQDVVTEFISQFNKKFAPYAQMAANQNIKWTTALTLASVIQREAAGSADMSLISGILWNRLSQKMPLDVDSTLQYARGDTATGWWAPITSADKKIDSSFNTYLHAGLPPHPISNPGVSAIAAALHPATTTCIYYIHDKNRQIHCATTYDEQQNNILKYLK